MRKLVLTLGLAAALVALPATSAMAAKHGTNRPFKGKGTVTLTLTAADGSTFAFVGTANVTHLGRTKVEGTGVNAPDGSFTLATTWTAANGAKITSTSTGTGAADGSFTTADTITGGTGRFATATGSGVTTGTAKPDATDPTVEHLKFKVAGTISY